ncbi:STAS domain-containing protein [Kitasatospora aureofaciens]|uniref:STAS domain-containing protein n=1 Tax=Kitasatospora aureofaciens TaxID=1894 RepID=UPI0036F49E61
MSPLNITHRTTRTGPVLHIAGELDYAQATALRQHVEQLALQPGQFLVLDLSDLAYCDSTGITTLLAARQHAEAAHAELVLAAVPATLLRVLTITGLEQVFLLRPAE